MVWFWPISALLELPTLVRRRRVADISLLDHQVELELPMDGNRVGEQELIPGAFQLKELVANALQQTEPYIDHPTEQKTLEKPYVSGCISHRRCKP